MEKYTFFCTPEQTKVSYGLGAPIDTKLTKSNGYACVVIDDAGINVFGKIPTLEQMCGWLAYENGIVLEISAAIENNKTFNYKWILNNSHQPDDVMTDTETYDSFEDAIVAGIDAALEYLTNNK